jgi:hypothetical protein
VNVCLSETTDHSSLSLTPLLLWAGERLAGGILAGQNIVVDIVKVELADEAFDELVKRINVYWIVRKVKPML